MLTSIGGGLKKSIRYIRIKRAGDYANIKFILDEIQGSTAPFTTG